ncbi:uncharacterized protein LOC118240638 [Electrophorus electricus]|uniref:uncharacterized protein LOC118240638 n=1 Tax=Electrophorus electricus TaxID=8005 RepID=UPI0015CFB37D|nr:uncharacterized protein LOC118240638 [Electrophorus electricus]
MGGHISVVTLTVHVKPTPELTSSLTGAALVGNPVTLHCKLDQSAGWSFYWSRHTQNPENETNTAANSYNISSVAPSDGGQYWCRAGRGNPVYYTNYSDAIWLNVTAGDSSSLGLVGLAVGLSLVVFSILLTLLWCYKTNKESLCRCTGSQSDINQTSDQTQRESGEAAHIYDTAERADRSSTDEPADDLSDVTYAQVMKHNKKSRNKDTGAGPSEVTYAEIELKPKQKAKKKEEKSSVGADTVYSELRQDSHKGQSSKIYGC